MATADQPGGQSSSRPPEIVTLGQEQTEPDVVAEPAGRVLIRAGVPGKPDLNVEQGKPYPNTTTDVAKLLAERGLIVTYEDERDQRSYVSFYAADIWIPILEFASSILGGISGNFFSDLIKELLDKEKPEDTIMHVELRVIPRKGPEKVFRASGKANDVLRAMDNFERDVRDN